MKEKQMLEDVSANEIKVIQKSGCAENVSISGRKPSKAYLAALDAVGRMLGKRSR